MANGMQMTPTLASHPYVAFPQTVDLLLEIDEDTFRPHLERFASSVWQVLMKVSHRPGQVRAGAH